MPLLRYLKESKQRLFSFDLLSHKVLILEIFSYLINKSYKFDSFFPRIKLFMI